MTTGTKVAIGVGLVLLAAGTAIGIAIVLTGDATAGGSQNFAGYEPRGTVLGSNDPGDVAYAIGKRDALLRGESVSWYGGT